MAGLIILLALFLRLINLNQPLWLDEAIQYQAISHFSLAGFFREFMPTDFNPPLAYLVNFGFSRLFGYSEIALRLPSVIFGVLTVWLVYKLGGKWPALLLATSGLHIYYSQEARAYSLAALAVTASFYFISRKNWTGYVIASLAAVYSHYLTILIFPAQWFWVKKKSWLWLFLGYLPWLPMFYKQLTAGQQAAGTIWGGVVGGLTLKNVLLVPVKFLTGRISWENNFIYAAVVILPLTLSVWLIWHHRYRRQWFLWLTVPLVLAGLISLWLPVLSYFRLLFVLPAFYLLISEKPTRFLLVGLMIFNLVTAGIYLFNPEFHREDWRSLAQNLDGRPVVIAAPVAAPLEYYWAGPVGSTGSMPDRDFYYAAYAEDIFDPQRRFRQKASEAGFRENSVNHYRGGLTLIEYIQ